MKKIMMFIFLIITCVLSSCYPSVYKTPMNESSNNISMPTTTINWESKTNRVKCAEDFLLLSPYMSKEEVDEILGITGVIDEYADVNRNNQYNYEYSDGNVIEICYFSDDYHILKINVYSDLQFIDANTIDCDLDSLTLESTYEDYVKVLGSKGILIGLNGDLSKIYLWVNSVGSKLEAEFDASTGLIKKSYNYF